MVTVVKPSGNIRRCINPRDLNEAIQREQFPMKTIEDVLAEIPDAKEFSKLNARSGLWYDNCVLTRKVLNCAPLIAHSEGTASFFLTAWYIPVLR